MTKLDRTDLKILQILQDEARITNQDLAERVSLSPSSCLQRVRRLESNGVISAYHAKVNLASVCRHVMCIATVTMKNHTREEFRAFEALINTIPEVVECVTVSGEFDFFLRIICPDMSSYLEINERLVSSVNYLVTINTHVVMNENKKFGAIDLSSLDEGG
ncbi:Lrp/AsnC family transcriptional regulator [Marinibactrum halimedae]|uniref:Lrp-family transcriptional regulator n=1 Tax=Marinibactrum halimedae TaxID=1444977 RepID=A0AA37WMD2_9GAMM|nr:Lrp/AsnC family transcriptional regulator [Marinibactrum halimedae]MCD9460186.1 Lrp/AsnC family transcriptional regulator [Marinibactrum halimedae]GLS26343.1 Lrp-family transcriptional regulator [Marinibactrum halimedae]